MLSFWGLLYQCVLSYSKLCLLLFYNVHPSTCTSLAKPSDVFGVPAAWLLLSIVMGLTAVNDVRSICSAVCLFFFFFRKRFSVNPYGFMVWYGDCNWTFFVNPYACMYGHLWIVLKSFSFKCGSFMLSTSPRPYNRFTDTEHTSISNERFVECSSAVQFEVGCADVARIVCCVSIDIPHFWEVFWGAVMNFLSIGVSHLNVWLGCWCLFLVYRKHRTHTTNGLQFCSGAFARRLCPF